MVLVPLSRGLSLTLFCSILTVNLNLLQIFCNPCQVIYQALKSSIKKHSFYPSKLLSIKGTGKCHQVSAVLNRNVRMEMRELSNMSAKEFSFRTLQKYKVTAQSDNDDEDDEC